MSASRVADKFVVRLPDGVRLQVTKIARTEHTSMNSWIVRAIEEKLARETAAGTFQDAIDAIEIALRTLKAEKP